MATSVMDHTPSAGLRRRRSVELDHHADHKRIGMLYGVTAFVFFLIGGLEALLIRLQLVASGQRRGERRDATTSCSPCTARR